MEKKHAIWFEPKWPRCRHSLSLTMHFCVPTGFEFHSDWPIHRRSDVLPWACLKFYRSGRHFARERFNQQQKLRSAAQRYGTSVFRTRNQGFGHSYLLHRDVTGLSVLLLGQRTKAKAVSGTRHEHVFVFGCIFSILEATAVETKADVCEWLFT